MRHILITHANCMDGHGVALAVKYHDKVKGIENREIHYCNYGDMPPEVEGANVIIGDFSFSRDILIDMNEAAESLVVLDHHKTAKENLEGLDFCIFDMSKSGAVLTWEYLFPSHNIPQLLKYIQDRDLWNWKLNFSKEISSYLQTVDFKNMEFIDHTDISRLLDMHDRDAMLTAGTAILAYQNNHIKKIAKKKEKLTRINIGGFDEIICINATTLISETGNALCEGEPFVAMYFDTEDKRVFSLRSHDDGEDVSMIAKKYGGGGHPRAAGFSVDKPKVLNNEWVNAIQKERDRQITEEGYDEDHDNGYETPELALAAASYALPEDEALVAKSIFPWSFEYLKKDKHDRKKQLVIAGALIVAELERLERL